MEAAGTLEGGCRGKKKKNEEKAITLKEHQLPLIHVPLSVERSDGIYNPRALLKDSGVDTIHIEEAVIVQVVLVALVRLDTLEPALDRVHAAEHGAHVEADALEGAECGARAQHRVVRERLEGRLAEATSNPKRVVDALANVLHLVILGKELELVLGRA